MNVMAGVRDGRERVPSHTRETPPASYDRVVVADKDPLFRDKQCSAWEDPR